MSQHTGQLRLAADGKNGLAHLTELKRPDGKWVVVRDSLLKPHYYMHSLNFYNFPYAFGLLFALGVYAVYKNQGDEFVPHYKELLRSTGEGKVADLAKRFGIDVKSREFWDASLRVIEEQVEKYCGLEA